MTARQRIKLRVKRALRHMTPRHLVRSHMTMRAIRRFADELGLVYFGLVDQRDDEHRLVRGHTVSATHRDENYCVGTVRGYDVALVSRNDVILTRNHKEWRCHWLICTVDLHSKEDMPHVYIGHTAREGAFAASYEYLRRVELGTIAPYPKRFVSAYNVYCMPGSSIDVERALSPAAAEVIAAHFGGASIEVEDNTVYVYIESEHPSEPLLERTVSNALWLAETFDTSLARPAVD